MAITPKSYKKNGYTYRESSPGSNKYQNFTAAKPMEKKPVTKAVPLPKPKPTTPVKKAVVSPKPGESSMARKEAARPTVSAVRQESRTLKADVATSRGVRGLSKAIPQAASKKSAMTYTGDAPGSDAEAYRGPVDRDARIAIATAPTKRQLNTLANASGLASLGSKLAARIGFGLAKRAAKTKIGQEVAKRLTAPPKLLTGPKPQVPRLTGPKPKPTKTTTVPSRPFPKGKGKPKGKRTPGTYTAN